MNTILLFIAVAIIWVWVIEARSRRFRFDVITNSVFAFLIAGLLGVCATVIIGGLGPQHLNWHTTQIVAANDHSSQTGSFFLASGTIKDELHWVFWYRWGDAIARFDTASNNILVYEDATPTTAHVDIGVPTSDIAG